MFRNTVAILLMNLFSEDGFSHAPLLTAGVMTPLASWVG
jgi:hypothetical protein